MGFVRQKPVYANEWAAQAFDKYPFFSFIEIGKALEFRSRALMNSALRERDMAWHGMGTHNNEKNRINNNSKKSTKTPHSATWEKEREKHTPTERKKIKRKRMLFALSVEKPC